MDFDYCHQSFITLNYLSKIGYVSSRNEKQIIGAKNGEINQANRQIW